MRLLLIVIALCACTRKSERYCGLHPEDLYNCPPTDAAGPRPMCTRNDECPTTAPMCFMPMPGAGGYCVGCTVDAQCAPGVCDPASLTCRGCVDHAQCASLACLPETGTCAEPLDVLYVDGTAGDDQGDCPITAPCKTIEYAVEQANDTRYHIKLDRELAGPVIIADKRITLLASPQARLVSVSGHALKTQGNTVHVYDLDVSCIAGSGIKAEMGSTLYVENVVVHDCPGVCIQGKDSHVSIARSRVTKCLDGGIFLESSVRSYSITNTRIFRNGDAANTRGGVLIDLMTAGTNNVFMHNTVADNITKAPDAGFNCKPTNLAEAPFNIISGNTNELGVPLNTAGGCIVTGSVVEPDSATLMFTPDYHLMSGSPAIDKIQSSPVVDDMDAEFRPVGAAFDFGADEFAP